MKSKGIEERLITACNALDNIQVRGIGNANNLMLCFSKLQEILEELSEDKTD